VKDRKAAVENEAKRKIEQLRSETEDWKEGDKIHELAVARLDAEDEEFLSSKSRVLEDYLDSTVMPHIIDGLVQICKDQPEDPVDALAAFLFARNRQLRKK